VEEILLRYSTVAENNCEIQPMDETLIIFGNGEETTSNTRTHLGDLEAIVCNDDQLTDDLVAIPHCGCRLQYPFLFNWRDRG
jgi:hypothetical protein